MKLFTEENSMINRIIEEKAIKILFQPIVTVKSNKIMIVEALSRGIETDGISLISPYILFNEAMRANKLKALDEICIKNALKDFEFVKNKIDNVLLSININMQTIIDNKRNNWFHTLVKEAGIDPKRIIIEILEDSEIDINILEKFVNYNKQKGYLIAIDDIGSGYSGLMRMSVLKPDIIKIDRSLITDISYKKSNQEIVRSLIELGHRLGILVTSEGIETLEDAMKLMEIGVDLQQGYYYSRPKSDIEKLTSKTFERIKIVSISYKKYLSRRINIQKELKTQRTEKVKQLCNQLENCNSEKISQELVKIIKNDAQIELLYVLNNDGIMITDTINRDGDGIQYSHYIFKPARKGEDFSLKNYFIKLNSHKDIYISSPYISTATGVECVTVSKRFTNNEGDLCILCVDLMSSNDVCKLG